MKNQKEITVKIEGKEWQEALDKAFTKANAKAKIDGFRPGKAPKDVFLKKYGKEALYMDAADICIQDAYTKALDDNKDLEIVAQPDIKLNKVDDKEIEFTFVFTTKPEVKLGKYKGLKAKKEDTKVTKEEIEAAIDDMRHHYAENVIKEGAIEDGDIAVIDFEGFKDGIPFEGGKAENYSLTIGSHTFIPGFEEQVLGMKRDEEKEIKVTFPEDYHSEDLKGKEVTFKVTIKEIKTVSIPELDKDFFEDLGMEGVTNKETLEKQIEENIKARKETEVENQYLDALLEEASKSVEVEIPDAMVHEEIHRMIHQYEENLQMQGLTLEQFYKYTNSDEAALEEQMHEEAHKRVLYRLMLEAIANAEGIKVSDAEAEEEATKMAEKYKMEKDEFLKLFGGLQMIKYDLEMRKAIEVLKG
jgi:trigger factor